MKKARVLLFLGILSLFSCISDRIDDKETINSYEEIVEIIDKHYFTENSMYQKNLLLTNKNVDWDNTYISQEDNKIVLIIIPVKNDDNMVLERFSFRIDSNVIQGHLWRFESDGTPFDEEDYRLSSHDIMKKMKGKVSYVSLDADSQYEILINKGNIINDIYVNHQRGDVNARCGMNCHSNGEPPATEIPPVYIHVPPKPIIPPAGWQPLPPIPSPPIVIIPPRPPKQTNPPKDPPCEKIKSGTDKANELGKTQKFKNAVQDIKNAFNANGNENGVAIGSHTPNGNPNYTPVQNFGTNSGTVNSPFPYPIADIHNHPNNSPPSFGDVYSMMQYHLQYGSFNMRFIITSGGTVYALVVTDPNAIAQFLKKFPSVQVPGYPPTLPPNLFNEWDDMRAVIGEAGALSHILETYNAGVALTKMDSAGRFRGVRTKKKAGSPGGGYQVDLCP